MKRIIIGLLVVALLLLPSCNGQVEILSYVGSINSDVYHYPECVWAQQIYPENEVWFDSPEEAQDAGYRACKVCNPPSESWNGISNLGWEPEALEARVTELAQEYEAAHPYAPEHVCWDMAVGLWQILDDNGITSFIVVRTGGEEVWLGHVWLIVIGKENLALGIESTTGTVYSPSYCEVHPDSDRAYAEYERLLEGHFYCNPTALEAEYPQLFPITH